jgi:hypothetical protein
MQCPFKNLFLSVETFVRDTGPGNIAEAAWRDSIR